MEVSGMPHHLHHQAARNARVFQHQNFQDSQTLTIKLKLNRWLWFHIDSFTMARFRAPYNRRGRWSGVSFVSKLFFSFSFCFVSPTARRLVKGRKTTLKINKTSDKKFTASNENIQFQPLYSFSVRLRCKGKLHHFLYFCKWLPSSCLRSTNQKYYVIYHVGISIHTFIQEY